MAEYQIYRWSAAHYISLKKTWVYGTLSVLPSCLRFEANSKATDRESVSIPYTDIHEIKKATSSFIFKCVVILSKDNGSWFGSLPNRDIVYTVIMHFWKNTLTGSPLSEQVDHSRQLHGTRHGQELLKLAHDSAKTLESSGRRLHRQGEQLQYASGLMADIHLDLDVAGKMTAELESWFGAWGQTNPRLGSPEPIMFVDDRGIPSIHEHPVLYFRGTWPTTVHQASVISSSKNEVNGVVRLSRDGITILDATHTQKSVHHFMPKDISVIRVHSPWKVDIVHYCLGKPDTAFALSSSKMPLVLDNLQQLFPSRLELLSPPEANLNQTTPGDLVHAPGKPDLDGVPLSRNPGTSRQEYEDSGGALYSSRSPGELSQTFVEHEDKRVMTNSEVQELSGIISQMKATAIDVGLEEERQLEVIDRLSDTVDRANMRLKHTTEKVKRLT